MRECVDTATGTMYLELISKQRHVSHRKPSRILHLAGKGKRIAMRKGSGLNRRRILRDDEVGTIDDNGFGRGRGTVVGVAYLDNASGFVRADLELAIAPGGSRRHRKLVGVGNRAVQGSFRNGSALVGKILCRPDCGPIGNTGEAALI